MNRRIALIVGVVGVAVLVLLRAAAADPSSLWHDMDRSGSGTTTQRSYPPPPPVTLPPMVQDLVDRQRDPIDLSGLFDVLLVIAAVAIVVLAVLWLARQKWRRPTRLGQAGFEVLPDVRADLAEAADGLDDVLAGGLPRNAIVACWVRLEEAVEAAGLPRDRSETAQEMAARVLRAYTVDHEAIGTLAALYREARFSVHELDESHRELAQRALADLRRQLQAVADDAAAHVAAASVEDAPVEAAP